MRTPALAILAAIAAAVVVALVILSAFRSPAPAPSAGTPAAAANEANAPALTGASRAEKAPAPAANSNERHAAPSVRASTPLARVLGRCVDGNGNPLAGCLATVRESAFAGSAVTLDAPEPLASTTSGADGTFELAFLPPERTALRVSAAGKVTMWRRPFTLRAGERLDVGDVRLVPGCRVRGTVKDTAGTPQADVLLVANSSVLAAENAERPSPAASHATRSVADGTFVFESPFAAGAWRWWAPPPKQLARETVLTVEPDEAEAAFDVVVLREVAELRGTVRDPSGAAVEGAQVSAVGSFLGGGVRTDAEGRFRLVRLEKAPPGDVQLEVDKEGYDLLRTSEKFAWGRDDVSLVLQELLAADVHVVAAEDGRPIERFGVRVWRPNRWSRDDLRVRDSGTHAGGMLRVVALRHGENLLAVEPLEDDRMPSDVVAVEGRDANAGTPMQRVELARRCRRVLQVRFDDGTPAAGTQVELLLPRGIEPTLESPVVLSPGSALASGTFLAEMQRPGTKQPLVVQKGTTGADGTLELSGHGDRALVLRLSGSEHLAIVVPDVRLDVGEPLVITVPRGATITGEVRPADVLAPLQPQPEELAMLQMMGAKGQEMLAAKVPGLRLRAPSGEIWPPGRPGRVPIAADGTFELGPVPTGTWHVELAWEPPAIGGKASYPFAMQTGELARVADLRPGERRRLLLDVSHLRHGRLEARVLLDGEPWVDGDVWLLCRKPGLRSRIDGQLMDVLEVPARTDAEGRVAGDVPPADWSVAVAASQTGQGVARRASADEFVTVAPGQTVRHDFRVVQRQLVVRVLQPDGSPAKERKFHVVPAGGRAMLPGGTTDAEGSLKIEPAPLGTFELVTWPLSLSAQDAQTKYIRAHPWPAWRDVLLSLGEVSVPAGSTTHRLELRLPPEPVLEPPAQDR